MLSKKGEKQDKFVIYLLLIEVFVIILILGIKREGNLAVALGTISMALAIVYIEIIKPWIQKPEIRIEFENKAPFCRNYLTLVNVQTPTAVHKGRLFGCFLRLKIRNVGRSLAKNLRGKLVEVIDKDGKTHKDFDPLFLHWVSITSKGSYEADLKVQWLAPIDLNAGEWEYLDVFNTLKEKETLKGFVQIGTKKEDRGSRMDFNISEGLKAFKITIYGENVEPVTETYKLKWDGENYNEITMQRIDQEETNDS